MKFFFEGVEYRIGFFHDKPVDRSKARLLAFEQAGFGAPAAASRFGGFARGGRQRR